jgi:hypothetical protein
MVPEPREREAGQGATGLGGLSDDYGGTACGVSFSTGEPATVSLSHYVTVRTPSGTETIIDARSPRCALSPSFPLRREFSDEGSMDQTRPTQPAR